MFVLSCKNIDIKLHVEDPIQKLLKEFISNSDSIGEQLTLSFTDSSAIYEVEASYIGIIKLNSGDTLKTLNVIHYTGLLRDAVRARGEIIFFDSKNKIFGKYGVGGKDILPSYIQDETKLVFTPQGDCSLQTIIDCSNALPKILFIEYTEKRGNFFNFSQPYK